MQDMKLFKNLTVQVITAVIIGVIVGLVWPDVGKEMKPLGDTFINAVKMVIAPIIFFTIVLGIAKMGDMKKVGKVGEKRLFISRLSLPSHSLSVYLSSIS